MRPWGGGGRGGHPQELPPGIPIAMERDGQRGSGVGWDGYYGMPQMLRPDNGVYGAGGGKVGGEAGGAGVRAAGGRLGGEK